MSAHNRQEARVQGGTVGCGGRARARTSSEAKKRWPSVVMIAGSTIQQPPRMIAALRSRCSAGDRTGRAVASTSIDADSSSMLQRL